MYKLKPLYLSLFTLLITLPAQADLWERRFDLLLERANRPPSDAGEAEGLREIQEHIGRSDPQITLSLERLMEAQEQLRARSQREKKSQESAIIMGAVHYQGEAIPGALSMEMELEVSLGREGSWKEVPLVGGDVLLKSAQLDGQDLPIYQNEGYYLWPTQASGAVKLHLSFLVPAYGDRGTLRYLFHGVGSPMTSLSCRFPQEGIKPKIENARRSKIETKEGITQLEATLGSGLEIKLSSARALKESETREAKLYAEDFALLSVAEESLELFVVLRYTILYAKQRRFKLRIPAPWTLTSAEGEDSFRYRLETQGEEQLLLGESSYPVEGQYEISLRLRRDLKAEAKEFGLRLPQALEVERQSGWLAMEVPGKLRLKERHRAQILALDLRQLPPEMLESAVNPILNAYHHDGPEFELKMSLTQLPEKELSSGSVDEVSAYSVITPSGQSLTEMRLSFRNRLRSRLKLRPRPGAKLRSALLNGNPVKVSEDREGWLLLPLTHSEAQEEAERFDVSVIIEEQLSPFGLLGRGGLELPAIELPVRALRWSLFLPLRDSYRFVEGVLPPQRHAGYAHWTRPLIDPDVDGDEGGGAEAIQASKLLSAETGSMPVRINVPRRGHRLNYRRYWLGGGQPMSLSFWHLRSWLRYPIKGFLFLFFIGAMLLGLSRSSRPIKILGISLSLGFGAATYLLSGLFLLLIALLLSLILYGQRRGWLPALKLWIMEWFHDLQRELQRFLEERKQRVEAVKEKGELTESAPDAAQTFKRNPRLLWRLALSFALLYLSLKIFGVGLEILERILS